MALIECCLSNITSEARIALDQVDHEVRETICLDRCGPCYDQPFLVVDGEIYTADDHHDLIESLITTDEVLRR